MRRPAKRDLAAAAATVAIVYALSWTAVLDRLDALSSDLMLALRHAVFGQRHAPAASPTVVVALDERTYRTPPFANLPKVLWTPQVAGVLDAVLAGGAKVVGFDVIFPTSLESYLPGFERPFLLSLRTGAREGRVVLGKVQHSEAPVSPFAAQSLVVGNERNIRSLNLLTDVDDVIRHVPLFFDAETGGQRRREPSMALELAARALGVTPVVRADGGVSLGEYSIPGGKDNALRINFQGGHDIPIYSLADLHACAEAGDAGYFERHFRGKVVILGAVLDVEDRKLTAKRFMTDVGTGGPVEPCRLGADDNSGAGSSKARDTVPGAYIHATAVNDLMLGEALRGVGRPVGAAITGALVLVVVGISLALRPLAGAFAVAGVGLGWVLLGLGAIQSGLVLPVVPVFVAMVLSYGVMLLYRYMVSDQQKLRIRRLFNFYLAPAVVDRMLDSDLLPQLGGEMRQVTIWFSDLSDFTALSEGLSPTELVSLMNRYFTVVTDIIESHGGFVDKYIGDAIVAVFGAPHDDPDHAGHAVAAALKAQESLRELNAGGAFGGRRIVTRIGINTGQALVGNVGSSRRFNYTVMGDTVNLASRLEGANKALGTSILLSGDTVARLPASIVSREVGMIRVKGRQAPVRVFEPLAIEGQYATPCIGVVQSSAPEPSAGQGHGDIERARRLAEIFVVALEHYRSCRFEEVARALTPWADDPAAVRLRARARELASCPPPPGWDGVDALTEK